VLETQCLLTHATQSPSTLMKAMNQSSQHHQITPTEVVQVLNAGPVWAPNRKGRAGVWLAVGRTAGGRALSLPVTYDDARRAVRPVTGWDTTRAEHTRYLKGQPH
jgi:hypothetical protein